MKAATALLPDPTSDTMHMVDSQESQTPLPEEVPDLELMEIGGCKIILEFSKTTNPSISKVIEEMLIESSDKRRHDK